MPGSAVKLLVQHAVHRRHRGTNRHFVKPDSQAAGKIGGILKAFPAGVGRRHHHGMNTIRTERIDRQRCDKRRVDPAGKPEHHTGETVLVHIVPETQREAAIQRRQTFIRRRHLARQRGGSKILTNHYRDRGL